MADTCFRIYDRNFIDLDAISAQVASSANSNFPITNINSAQRRSKVWRSNGYFEVTSSNNDIIFEETDGVPLTASITVGEYTSHAAMCTAIEDALNAAGASTYTCDHSSSTGYKFKISSNRAGGGGIFELLMGDASNTSEDLLGFDAVDLSDAADHTADLARACYPGEFIRWDMGVSTNPKGFALIGTRNDPIGVSDAATIRLQANITNDFSSPAFETTLTYNSRGLLHENTEGIADQPYRYWRVLIEDVENPNSYVSAGAVLLGNYFNPARGRVQFGLRSNYTDRTRSIFSEGGQTFSDIKENSQSFNVVWNFLQKEDIEDIDIFFDKVKTGIPFFVSMDAGAIYTTEAERALRFVKFERPPSYTLDRPDIFKMGMSLREEL